MKPITIECQINFHRCGYGGRKEIRQGGAPSLPMPVPNRVPRIARFMALAIRFEGLIQSGAITNYADLARLAHVSRARITQIMNLLLLAPDIQEAILFLPHLAGGRDPIHILQVQPIALLPDWREQRQIWRSLCGSAKFGVEPNQRGPRAIADRGPAKSPVASPTFTSVRPALIASTITKWRG